MITLFLAFTMIQDADPDGVWYLAAGELVFEAFAVVILIGLVVW